MREILVRGPDAHLLHTFVGRGDACGGSECIVGFQLGHGPHGDPHGGQGVLEWMKLREQGRLDALTSLVAGPEPVAEGLDDVVGRHAQVRGSLFDHLQDAVEHADDRAKRRIFALVEAAQPVEVTEQLVRAIDEVNDHG